MLKEGIVKTGVIVEDSLSLYQKLSGKTEKLVVGMINSVSSLLEKVQHKVDNKKLLVEDKSYNLNGLNSEEILDMGDLLRESGKIDLSIEFYHEAINNNEGDYEELNDIYYSLGLSYRLKGDIKSSIEFVEKSLQSGNYSKIGVRSNELALLHLEYGDYDSAIELFKYAINFGDENIKKEASENLEYVYNNL